MKVIITKVPQNSKLKRGDTVNASGAQIDALVEGGHEYMTEAEHEAIKAREENAEQSRVQAEDRAKAAVTEAVVQARGKGVFAPKEDTEAIEADALKMETTKAGLGVRYILNQPVKATNQDTLRNRVTGSSDKGPSGITVGASLQQEMDGYIRASEPMTKLIQGGNFKEAIAISRERASILAAGIKPLLNRGDDVRFRDLVAASNGMSHSEMVKAVQSDPDSHLGTVSTGLLLTEDLGYLVNMLGFLKSVSTDFSDKPARFGEPIYTRYKGVPDVLTYVPGVGFTSDATAISTAGAGTVQSALATATASAMATTPTNYVVTKSVPATTDVTVTLNQLKSVDIEFGLDKLASTVRNYFAEQKPMEIYALAEKIATHFMSTVYAASWSGAVTQFIEPLVSWNLKSLTRLKAAMSVSKIPPVGRFALLHTFYHDALLEDPAILTSKAILTLTNPSMSVFEQTRIPSYAGIQPIETQLASAAGSTVTAWTDPTTLGSITKVGFAGNASSMVFVSRVPQDFTSLAADLKIPATAAVEIVTEPESGISMMFWRYMDLGKMSIVVRACLMWGDAQGDPRTGFPIKPA